MQDFSSVNIKNMIIHNVGNKVKGESLDLSTEICDTNNKVTQAHQSGQLLWHLQEPAQDLL